tara:strand:- start:13755 stop:14858 length:1104 start_codon:yes stop_codon:yes gene_type:complete
MATIEKRTRKDGSVYRVMVRIKGMPPVQKSFRRKTDAQLWAQQTEAALRRGELQNVLKPSTRHTLSEAIDRYKEEILPHKSTGTIRSETAHLAYWKAELGDYAPAYIDTELVRKKLKALASENLNKQTDSAPRTRSVRTLKYYRHTLSMVFKHMRKWGWTAYNPVEDVDDGPKLNNAVERYLSTDERERLIETARKSHNTALYPIVMLALTTGGRKGEILGLTLDCVDVQRAVIVFRNTKNGDTRALPLVPQVLDLAREQVKAADAFYDGLPRHQAPRYLFPNAYGTAPIEINRAWYKALKDAGIENFRFHDLRHTTASYLAMNGASQLDIAAVLGHRTLQMVKRYAHLSEGHTRGVLEDMADKIRL